MDNLLLPWILIFVNCLFLEHANCGGVLTLELVEYKNAKGLGANGHCCDGKWKACFSNGCDHYFHICMTNRTNSKIPLIKRHAMSVENNLMKMYGRLNPDSTDVDAGCAENGYKKTGVFENKNTIKFTGKNAVKITLGQPEYLDSDYTVQVRVFDKDDVFKDDYVDTLKGNIHLEPLGSNKTFTIKARTELTATIWYTCDDNYYDCDTCGARGTPRCSVHCKASRPENHHGSCTQHGKFSCYEGWKGENCTEEITTTTSTTTTTSAETITTTITTTTSGETIPSTDNMEE